MALVCKFDFRDNADSAVITDSIGANTGTLVDGDSDFTSAHQAVGPLDMALELDGANDRFTVAAAADINITGHAEYSMVAWVKLTTSDNKHTLLAKGSHVFRINIDGSFYNEIAHASDNAIGVTTVGDVSINAGKWQMVAVVYNEDGAKKIKSYVDGVLVANSVTDQAGTDAIGDDSGVDLTVGSNDAATSHFIEGKLADYRIYDHALTAQEILVLYEQTAIWRYDED